MLNWKALSTYTWDIYHSMHMFILLSTLCLYKRWNFQRSYYASKATMLCRRLNNFLQFFFFIAVIVFVNIILSDKFLHDSENEWFDDREAMVTYWERNTVDLHSSWLYNNRTSSKLTFLVHSTCKVKNIFQLVVY